jgi:hypothetical protein
LTFFIAIANYEFLGKAAFGSLGVPLVLVARRNKKNI